MTPDIRAGLDACTRCGLCLQACPTYRDLRSEADSPRGRVFLIDRSAELGGAVDATLAEHLYACLGCRACETACPSGVPFGKLLAYGRHQVESAGEVDPSRRGWRLFRRIAFEWILPNRLLFWIAMAPARLLQRWPTLAGIVRQALPPRLRGILTMLPAAEVRGNGLQAFVPAQAPRRARVALFTGCVMNALFPGVHGAVVRVLARNGCDVVAPRGQWCCGALNLHAGERRHARAMARRNIDAFEAAQVDAIVVDSAGCGAEMKSYGELLGDDGRYAARAVAFAAKVRDAAEFLADLGLRGDAGRLTGRVTYQDACHLAHAQGVRDAPRALLAFIDGLKYVEMQGADRCCGAAGVYSLTHPEMSSRILDEKMSQIEATGADTVAVSNPGCHMQLLAGAAASGRRLRVRHVFELLDEAYRAR